MKEAMTYEELKAELEKQKQINVRLAQTVLEMTQKYRELERIITNGLQELSQICEERNKKNDGKR